MSVVNVINATGSQPFSESSVTVSLAALTPLAIVVPNASEIIDVSIYSSGNIDISDSIDIIKSGFNLTLESNIALTNIVVKTISKT